MILIRARTDSPITIASTLPGLMPDHPLFGTLCQVCYKLLNEGAISLVLIGFPPDVRAEGKLWGVGATVAVHAWCAEAPDGGAASKPLTDRS